MLDITLIGTGGTMPRKDRFLASCLLNVNGHSVLIDCGEGTQVSFKICGRKMKPIDMICFTHFHADHITGLPGLLLTMGNEGRTEPVTIVGPVGLTKTVRDICVAAPNLPFTLCFRELTELKPFVSGALTVTPFRAKHSIPCIGYTLELPHRGKFDIAKAQKNNVPMKIWSILQKEDTVCFEGNIFTSDMVLGAPRKSIKLTYCTDSRPTEAIWSAAKNADLLICEGMYSDDSKLPLAKEKGHMLFSEAARLAKSAGVQKLWLTHFSPSLDDPQSGLALAQEIFSDTECGFDGKSITLKFV